MTRRGECRCRLVVCNGAELAALQPNSENEGNKMGEHCQGEFETAARELNLSTLTRRY